MTTSLLRLLQRTDPTLAELLSGVLALGWGAWLLLPGVTFGVAPIYDAMATIAPEWLWGLVVACGGLIQVTNVLRGALRARWFAAFAGVLSWGLVAALFAFSTPLNTATPVYSILCLSQMWACWRIALEQAGVRKE